MKVRADSKLYDRTGATLRNEISGKGYEDDQNAKARVTDGRLFMWVVEALDHFNILPSVWWSSRMSAHALRTYQGARSHPFHSQVVPRLTHHSRSDFRVSLLLSPVGVESSHHALHKGGCGSQALLRCFTPDRVRFS